MLFFYVVTVRFHIDYVNFPADKVQALTIEINGWNTWCQEADNVFSDKITSKPEGSQLCLSNPLDRWGITAALLVALKKKKKSSLQEGKIEISIHI